ncbi:MAG: penicillin-binding protein activator [Desulfurococcales archaeon]|nr:penicillin-binding protein activator [Desulfurococcales archaeon]
MKWKVAALALAALMVIAPAVATLAAAQQEPVTITIGALLPLTGDLQSYGERAQAAIEFAVQEMNQYLQNKSAWFRLDLVVEDTQTKPDIAVQKFNALIAQGIKFVVGPMTSASVKSIKDTANQQNVLVISPSSTAIELAIPNDNVFRFCPADDVQSKAIGALVRDLGIKAVVIIDRKDTWGIGLANATENVLNQLGVEVKSVYGYNPESPTFSAIASSAQKDVKDLINEYGTSKVAVIAIGFKEVKDLFAEARKYPSLGKVLWIGSDGTALLTEIVSDPVAGAFGEQVHFINPIFSPAATDEQQKVAQYVKQKLGVEPDAYSLAAHDAVVAITLALLQAGPTEDPNEMVNKVKQLLPQITQSDEFAKYAATGKFPLNEAGDRATADYDWWTIAEQGGNYTWVKVGSYHGNSDTNEWFKVDALGGKTFPEVFQEAFGGAPATTTAGQQSSTTSPAQTSPAQTSPAGGGQAATTTTQKGGKNTALIAGIVIVIIIVIAAAALAKRS